MQSLAIREVESVSELSSSTDRKSTRLNSSHGYISYAVFCLKKKIYSDAGDSCERCARRPGDPAERLRPPLGAGRRRRFWPQATPSSPPPPCPTPSQHHLVRD